VYDIISKKYIDRKVIVEGHTDNIGNKEYNQRLTEQRAHTVAKYLHSMGLHDKLSYKGYGEEKPINKNESSEGRKKKTEEMK